MKIVLLAENVATRIAAGEVVERPASVVKELVENAVDAGAKEVSTWVEGSGAALIRVSDDGEGIAAEELSLSVERHCTSKLKDEADLFRISTLGFRGEALPSIAAVSKLEIVSRTRQEELGARLRVEGGKKGEVAPAGCPAGTTVEVRELFFNTPARRKFLKSPATELGHISDVISRMALACGDVHFRLHHAGREIADYAATPRVDDRPRQVLGPEIADGMASFSSRVGAIKISGFLSLAPSSFSSTRYLMTYVNRRFVRDRILTHAVLQGYETLLMKGRYPAVVLYVEIPFEEVDVNVHPAKYEVRFRRQQGVHDAVAEAVRNGLKRGAKEPVSLVAHASEKVFPEVRETSLSYSVPAHEGIRPGSPQTDASDQRPRREEAHKGFFSSLDVLGQVLGCYLVCAAPRGVVLIDQHAAHERVAFEKMRRRLEQGEIEAQNLLLPQILEMPFSEARLFEQRLSVMERLGFTIEPFGSNSFAIKAVPALLPPGDYREVMRRMVAEVADVGESGELRHELEERLMTIACHGVIRANRKLSREEIQALLNELDQIDFATQCPHGRPVLVEFTQEQIERMFKRA